MTTFYIIVGTLGMIIAVIGAYYIHSFNNQTIKEIKDALEHLKSLKKKK